LQARLTLERSEEPLRDDQSNPNGRRFMTTKDKTGRQKFSLAIKPARKRLGHRNRACARFFGGLLSGDYDLRTLREALVEVARLDR